MDSLNIKQLSIATRIGVHAWEQRILQTVFLDISIPLSLKEVTHDDLASVIDYDLLCEKVTNLISSNTFQLIETLANQVADFIKKEYDISEVQVCVSKPHAVKNAGNIQVTVNR